MAIKCKNLPVTRLTPTDSLPDKTLCVPVSPNNGSKLKAKQKILGLRDLELEALFFHCYLIMTFYDGINSYGYSFILKTCILNLSAWGFLTKRRMKMSEGLTDLP